MLSKIKHVTLIHNEECLQRLKQKFLLKMWQNTKETKMFQLGQQAVCKLGPYLYKIKKAWYRFATYYEALITLNNCNNKLYPESHEL